MPRLKSIMLFIESMMSPVKQEFLELIPSQVFLRKSFFTLHALRACTELDLRSRTWRVFLSFTRKCSTHFNKWSLCFFGANSALMLRQRNDWSYCFKIKSSKQHPLAFLFALVVFGALLWMLLMFQGESGKWQINVNTKRHGQMWPTKECKQRSQVRG